MTENSPNAAPSSKPSAPSAPKKRSFTGRIVLAAILLVITGLVLFVSYTEQGSKIFGVALDATEKWFEGGSPEKEKIAAEKIEELDFMVVREGEEHHVTSIQRKGKHVDKQVFELLPDLFILGTVNVSDTDVSDEQLKSLKSLKHLSSLLLSGTNITDEGISHLRNHEALESMHMKNTKITDAGIEFFVSMPDLKILDVSGTKITDAGLKTLAQCKNLNWLLINNTAVTNEGIKALKALPRLGRLSILNTKVTSEGIDDLLTTFPKLKTDVGDAPEPSNSASDQSDSSPDSEPKAE
jgi:Leucine-rich repeat (LRR) protein